jgi:hypothetical protein
MFTFPYEGAEEGHNLICVRSYTYIFTVSNIYTVIKDGGRLSLVSDEGYPVHKSISEFTFLKEELKAEDFL